MPYVGRPYVGRFAPSPTGELHLGSLTTAVASYLHARQAGGEWLVRVEDIDPPREINGAAASILNTLEAFKLHWDRSVLYQSTRLGAYEAVARDLLASGQAFLCSCSRRDVRSVSGGTQRYPGTCRNRQAHSEPTAIRVRTEAHITSFVDGLQGPSHYDVAATDGDYVVFRRDGLPAYHLAVVLDDGFQGVTDIVRGVDLLGSTAVHINLQQQLGLGTHRYWHLPVIVHADGDKLSKQTGAQGITAKTVDDYAFKALQLLGAQPPPELQPAPPAELWAWALDHWQIETLASQREVLDPLGFGGR